MKIRTKLMLSYLGICILPVLIISSVLYESASRSMEESSLEFTAAFSSQIVTNLDEFLETYDHVTKSVLVDNETINQLSGDPRSVVEELNLQLAVRKIMMRIMALRPEIKNILLLTKDNQIYQFSKDGDQVDKEVLKEQDWLYQIEQSDEVLTITAMHDRSYYDRRQDGIVLTVGRQLFNSVGNYMGVLLIDLESAGLIELSEEFLQAKSNYNVRISITNEKGDCLYDSDLASGQVTWNEVQNLGFIKHYENSEEYLFLTKATKRSGLWVNAVIPKKKLLAKIRRMRCITYGAVLISVAAFIALSWLMSRGITKSIRSLQQSMKQVETGNYQVMLQEGGRDEIGDLIRSYNHMIHKIKNLIEEVYVAEIQEKDARFLALQTQINPHMLYNTLESIRMNAVINGDDDTAGMIKLLARMFRMTLDANSENHRIQDEIDYVENYLKLQALRFPGQFFWEVKVEEDVRQTEMISMVLQPIVENSIEHGFRGRAIPLHISLEGFKMQTGDILIRISDDGKGMDESAREWLNSQLAAGSENALTLQHVPNEGRASIGLKNISERIRLRYGSAYGLFIAESSEKGTVVEIRIPEEEQRMNGGHIKE